MKKELISTLLAERHGENQGGLHGKCGVGAGLERWTGFRQGGRQNLKRGTGIDMARETGMCGPHSRHLRALVHPEPEAQRGNR